VGLFGGEESAACDMIDKVRCIRGGKAAIVGIVA
jgi:hypothetical protein